MKHASAASIVTGLLLFAVLGVRECWAQSVPDDSLAQSESKAQTKSPTGAALRSLAIPGWGQFYNEKKIKAGLVFAAEAGMIGTAIYWDHQASEAERIKLSGLSVSDSLQYDALQRSYEDNRNLAFWFLAGTIVLSMLDAYVDAHLFGFDEDASLAAIDLIDPQSNSIAFTFRLRVPL